MEHYEDEWGWVEDTRDAVRIEDRACVEAIEAGELLRVEVQS